MSQLQLPKTSSRSQNIDDAGFIQYGTKTINAAGTSELTNIPAGAVRVLIYSSAAFSISHVNSAGFPVAAGGTIELPISALGVHKIYITSTAVGAQVFSLLYSMLEVV